MKKTQLLEMRNKSLSELNKLVAEKRMALMVTRAKLKSSQEKNLKKKKGLDHELSQILTIIKEKELSEKSEKAPEKGETK